jgi:hypothetical protein
MEMLYRMTVRKSRNILLKYNRVTKELIAAKLGDGKYLLVFMTILAFMDGKLP